MREQQTESKRVEIGRMWDALSTTGRDHLERLGKVDLERHAEEIAATYRQEQRRET